MITVISMKVVDNVCVMLNCDSSHPSCDGRTLNVKYRKPC